jgi:hypothetical protein
LLVFLLLLLHPWLVSLVFCWCPRGLMFSIHIVLVFFSLSLTDWFNSSILSFISDTLFSFFFNWFYIYSHVYTLFGSPLPTHTPLPGRNCSAILFSNFVEEKT